MPQGADLVLASDVPHGETPVLVLHGLHAQAARVNAHQFTKTTTNSGAQGREQSSNKLVLLTDLGSARDLRQWVANCLQNELSGDHKQQNLVHHEKTIHVRGQSRSCQETILSSPRQLNADSRPITQRMHTHDIQEDNILGDRLPAQSSHQQARQRPKKNHHHRKTRADGSVDCKIIGETASHSSGTAEIGKSVRT